MALSRKVFEKVAKIIKKQDSCKLRRDLTNEFSSYFSEENPRFDRNRFKKASGGDC